MNFDAPSVSGAVAITAGVFDFFTIFFDVVRRGRHVPIGLGDFFEDSVRIHGPRNDDDHVVRGIKIFVEL